MKSPFLQGFYASVKANMCHYLAAFVRIIKITNGPAHLTLKSEEEQGRKLDQRHEIFQLQSSVLLAFVLLVHLNPHA